MSVFIFLGLISSCASPPSRVEPKASASQSPHDQRTSGIFDIYFDSSGRATDVRVIKSTGSELLDNTSVRTLRRWHRKPGKVGRVRVPITYTMKVPEL